jgi:hypothetical protein
LGYKWGSDNHVAQYMDTDTLCGIGFSSDNTFNDNLNKGEYVQGCLDARRDHPPAKDPGKYETP